jgi:hypothetical protein
MHVVSRNKYHITSQASSKDYQSDSIGVETDNPCLLPMFFRFGDGTKPSVNFVSHRLAV